MSDRERVADELRRVRDDVRDRALAGPAAAGTPPPPHRQVVVPGPMPPDAVPAPQELPPRPDNAELNDLWALRSTLDQGGLRRAVARGLGRLLSRLIDRQEAFNSRQVQFDNAILDYIDARAQATHRHYDAILGIHGRHMGEIDERHLIMQEELVAHVHDLVKRIDLVLGESDRGRLGLELALRDVRTRLLRLEGVLAASGGPKGGAPDASAAGGASGGPKGQAPDASAGAGASGGPKDPQLNK